MEELIKYDTLNIPKLIKYIRGKKLAKIFNMITHYLDKKYLDKSTHFRVLYFCFNSLHINGLECNYFIEYITQHKSLPYIWLYNLENIHNIIKLVQQPIGELVRSYKKRLIGHRGCGYYKDNSKKAIICGIDRECDIIEVDIQRYSNGYVCGHDNLLQNDLSLGPTGGDILTIYELAEIVDGRNINVMFDCKFGEKWIEEFYEIINRLFRYYTIASFYERHLLIDCMNKTLITGSIPSDHFMSVINTLNIDSISLYYNNITSELVNELHHNGISVYVYTIDDPGLCKNLLEMDIDGIITNYP